MPLLSQSAIFLTYDVPEATAEHDHWHTYEHLPERLSVPGFLRGTRWVATAGSPRYFVLYEVTEPATLTSEAYMARLNNPSEWTQRVMPLFRGMTRGLCTVSGSFGFGLGNVATLLRFKPAEGDAAALRQWLLNEVLPGLPAKPGLGSVHLLEGTGVAPMTNEQRLRGRDAGVDWALVLTGYDREALDGVGIGPDDLLARGATGVAHAAYRKDYTLAQTEIDA